ncbi:MAG: DUF1684 domain-containing protein [Pseudopedobacter sp.]|nr:DUF1684 domain-containing protein [Deinococcales bacterium]
MWWNSRIAGAWCISVNSAQDLAQYAAQYAAQYRERRDAFFASPQSPLSSEDRARFTGLNYYPFDPAYRFTLEPTRKDFLEPVEIENSSGEKAWYLLWGQVSVPFAGRTEILELYIKEPEESPSSVFIPFKDNTNGSETCGTGRYLDAMLEGRILTLDFNLTYSPFCAYGDGWTCPLPPRANWLGVSVRAGERLLEF